MPRVCWLSWPALTSQCRYLARISPAEGRNHASGSVEGTQERGAGSRIALKWLAVARPRGAQEKLLFASYRQCSTELYFAWCLCVGMVHAWVRHTVLKCDVFKTLFPKTAFFRDEGTPNSFFLSLATLVYACTA